MNTYSMDSPNNPYYGLSKRAARVLLDLDIVNKEQAASAIQSGGLHPKNPNCHGLGRTIYREVTEWVNITQMDCYVCPKCGHVTAKLPST